MEAVIGPHGYPLWYKDPQSVKDYSIDWTLWLNSDTIATSTWEVNGDLVKDSSGNTPTHASVWLSGGTNGKSYLVRNKIVTAGGRTEVQTLEILVKKK